MLASFQSVWQIPLTGPVALALGAGIGAFGASLYLSARIRFRSFRLTWGLTTDRLVTGGIYRFSRNPQSVGWLLFLVGVGVACRSGAGLFLAGAFLVSCFVWLPVEERILFRRFGEEYRRYRDSVPRYLGLPRGPSEGRFHTG